MLFDPDMYFSDFKLINKLGITTHIDKIPFRITHLREMTRDAMPQAATHSRVVCSHDRGVQKIV